MSLLTEQLLGMSVDASKNNADDSKFLMIADWLSEHGYRAMADWVRVAHTDVEAQFENIRLAAFGELREKIEAEKGMIFQQIGSEYQNNVVVVKFPEMAEIHIRYRGMINFWIIPKGKHQFQEVSWQDLEGLLQGDHADLVGVAALYLMSFAHFAHSRYRGKDTNKRILIGLNGALVQMFNSTSTYARYDAASMIASILSEIERHQPKQMPMAVKHVRDHLANLRGFDINSSRFSFLHDFLRRYP